MVSAARPDMSSAQAAFVFATIFLAMLLTRFFGVMAVACTFILRMTAINMSWVTGEMRLVILSGEMTGPITSMMKGRGW